MALEPPRALPAAEPAGGPAGERDDRPVDELERLAELRLSGVLSQDEYDELALRVLAL